MNAINLIFPHQLFQESPLLHNGFPIYLIEEFLFFRQYQFHKQKIALHRASMKCYQQFLEEQGLEVYYIESADTQSDMRKWRNFIESKQVQEIYLLDPVDDWLRQRIDAYRDLCVLKIYDTPKFLSSPEDLKPFFRKDKKSFLQANFYQQQRKRLGYLVDGSNNPLGGKWSFDAENRKKFPAHKTPPAITYPPPSAQWDEAVAYTQNHFSDNLGHLDAERYYPITHKEAEEWLEQFLNFRFHEFGPYEDAILKEHSILHHSVLSPLLNTGLILPQQVMEQALGFAQRENVPLNSTEGFVRQIIGWREFIRGMYVTKGRYSRTRNFWKATRPLPSSFYDGTTGILPIDETIKKVLRTGYTHHIERLMVLGNFMLLCEFDPDAVYQWFMELFIDAYDWVMVPNVYGMVLFADGGTFATKPYVSGSNYIRKMSNYPSGEWENIWDGLFWRFILKNEAFFAANPRLRMMVTSLHRMSPDKKTNHVNIAEAFLARLDQQTAQKH